MSRFYKAFFLMALLFIGACPVAKAEWESHRWVVGTYPNRIGLVGIGSGDGRVFTKICFGQNEVYNSIIVPLHIYVVTLMVNIAILTGIGLFYWWHRRRRRSHDGTRTDSGDHALR